MSGGGGGGGGGQRTYKNATWNQTTIIAERKINFTKLSKLLAIARVMSLTEEQQAFLLRKLRTWFAAQDVDKNGYITAEDFEEIAKRFVKYGKLEEKKGKEITEAYYGVIKNFGLENRGDKMTLERYLEGAMKFRENPRSQSSQERQ